MANNGNLKPFKPGPDPRRNMNGRPIGSQNLRSHFDELLQRKINNESDKTIQDVLVERIIQMALDGNFKMIKLIWEYQDGKPPQWRGNLEPPRPPKRKLSEEELARIHKIFGPKDWPDEGHQ